LRFSFLSLLLHGGFCGEGGELAFASLISADFRNLPHQGLGLALRPYRHSFFLLRSLFSLPPPRVPALRSREIKKLLMQ
jgi:hypothetical protein